MRIAESFWKKAITTGVVAVALAFLYETTTRDSWYAARGGL